MCMLSCDNVFSLTSIRNNCTISLLGLLLRWTVVAIDHRSEVGLFALCDKSICCALIGVWALYSCKLSVRQLRLTVRASQWLLKFRARESSSRCVTVLHWNNEYVIRMKGIFQPGNETNREDFLIFFSIFFYYFDFFVIFSNLLKFTFSVCHRIRRPLHAF